TAPENLLANQRHHNGMIDIMVGCITVRNIFERQPSDKANYAGIVWFKPSVVPFILGLQLANKSIDNNLRGVKHRTLRSTIENNWLPGTLSFQAPSCATRRPSSAGHIDANYGRQFLKLMPL